MGFEEIPKPPETLQTF